LKFRNDFTFFIFFIFLLQNFSPKIANLSNHNLLKWCVFTNDCKSEQNGQKDGEGW